MKANYFTILWWFLLYIDMTQPWVYMCPPILKPPPHLCPPHPSGLSQSTSFECPASCIKLALVIYLQFGLYISTNIMYVVLLVLGFWQNVFLWIKSLSLLHGWKSLISLTLAPLCKNLPILSSTLWIANKYIFLKSIKFSPHKINIDLNYKINLQYSLCL